MNSKRSGGGFPVVLTLAVAVSLAILLTLGTWQVQRLHWKEELLARIAALQVAPAQPLGPVLQRLARGEDVAFTRVSIDCPGIGAAPYVELYGLHDGAPGSRLISACRVDGAYRSLLVDRGFVAAEISARPPQTGAQAPMRIVGVLRPPEAGNAFSPKNRPDRWFVRDIVGMAAALKAPAPAPVTLMAETSSNPEWLALTPAPIPTDIPNNHLGYAITWYGLAAALLGVYAAMLFRRRNT